MNKALWDEFINGKVAVNCRTENQAKKFLRICENNHLEWSGKDKKPTSHTNWERNFEDTCYINEEDGLYCSDTCQPACYKVITFKQLMKSDRPKEDKQEQFRGWQILKMIEDGKLKEGDKIIWHNGADTGQDKYHIGALGEIIADGLNIEIDCSYLNHNIAQSYFTIGEKEPKHYLTFDEAIKHDYLKYKTWNEFELFLDVFKKLGLDFTTNEARQMMQERAWEIEE